MRRVVLVLLVGFLAVASSSANTGSVAGQPIAFTKNMGQWPDSILFRASANGEVLWFTKDGVYHQFFRRVPRADSATTTDPLRRIRPLDPTDRFERDSVETTMIKAEFVGSNPDVEVIGLDELDYKCNYFLGNDPSKWRTNVPNYAGIVMKGLYDGVDVTYYSTGDGRIEYDLIVLPSIAAVIPSFRYENVLSVHVSSEGNLVAEHTWGKLTEHIPIAFQPNSEPGQNLTSCFQLNSQNLVSFGIRGRIDPLQPLVIDPVLEYSTYLGGVKVDECTGIAASDSGQTYVVGQTFSADFPTVNPIQPFVSEPDIVVSGFSATGAIPIFSTYIGGVAEDWGAGIALAPDGTVCLAGSTWSIDFPLVNPFQPDVDYEFGDAAVIRLSSSGNTLLYSTSLGGWQLERARGIAVGSDNSIFVVGNTESEDFPVVNNLYPFPWSRTAFVTKFSPDGGSLVYSTWLGGTAEDRANAVSVDTSGSAYIVGYTRSSDFPTKNAYQTDYGWGGDAFLTKIEPAGTSIAYSTFLGGSYSDWAEDVAVDYLGNAHVIGRTISSDFPTANPIQEFALAEDAFVAKLSAPGDELLFSTFLGGSGYDRGNSLVVLDHGQVAVSGVAGSSDFPTLNSFQNFGGFSDAFVTIIQPADQEILFSTFLGGYVDEYANAIASDAKGDIYVAGSVYSDDFPVLYPFQTDQPTWDAFLLKIAVNECCYRELALRGDIAIPTDGITDGSDLGVAVDRIFFGDETALDRCLNAQDVNDDLVFDGGDLGILVDYIFFGDTSVIKRCDGSPY